MLNILPSPLSVIWLQFSLETEKGIPPPKRFSFSPNVFQLPQGCNPTSQSAGHHPECASRPSSSGIQACYSDPVMLCDRPGRALAVCVNPDQSLPLLDGRRHQRPERSQSVIKPGLMSWAGRSVRHLRTLEWLSVVLNIYVLDWAVDKINLSFTIATLRNGRV